MMKWITHCLVQPIQREYLKEDLFANLITCPFVGGINVSSFHWLDIEKQIETSRKKDQLQNHRRTYCLELTPFYTKWEITFVLTKKSIE